MAIKFLSSTRVRYLLFTALVLVHAGAIVYFLRRDTLYDFNVYYLASYGFTHGVDVYAIGYDSTTTNLPHWQALAAAAHIQLLSFPYLYPPLTAQLIVPLLGLSEFWAGATWLILSAVAFLLSAWLLGKMWTQPEGPSIVYLLMLGFMPILFTFLDGQVNGFVLLALTVGLFALNRRKGITAGAALAVAALLKMLPIVLCLYLGWRKQWLALAAAVVTLIGLLLTTIPMFGPQVLTSYIQNFSSTTRSEFLYARIHNQGLTGVWLRVLNGVADTATIYWVYLLSAAIIVVLTITLCWPMRDLPTYWRFEYALILCALLMIPQYMWYHMLSLLFIPLVTVVEYLWRHQRWKLMALVLLLYLFTGVHGLVFHKEFAVSRWLTLFPFIFMFLLWSLLGWMIRVERRAERVNAGSREESLGAAYNLGSIALVGNAGKSESSVVQ